MRKWYFGEGLSHGGRLMTESGESDGCTMASHASLVLTACMRSASISPSPGTVGITSNAVHLNIYSALFIMFDFVCTT